MQIIIATYSTGIHGIVIVSILSPFMYSRHKGACFFRENRKIPRVLVQSYNFKALNRLRTPRLPAVL